MDPKLKEYFSKLGKKSAKARMEKITKADRSRIAKKAAQARWQKKAGRSC